MPMPRATAAVPAPSRAHSVSYSGGRSSRCLGTSSKLRISCLSQRVGAFAHGSLRERVRAMMPRRREFRQEGVRGLGTIAGRCGASAHHQQQRFVNSLFIMLGIESWKPILAALVLPPVPLLLLTLVGARLLLPRRGLGWLLIFISVVLLWLSACSGAARGLGQLFLQPPAAMSFDRVRELRAEIAAKKPLAIVILGAGVEPFAPEYGVSSLQYPSLERLRYGLWLARETGAPVAFSGGVGWGQPDAAAEAKVAAKIAAEEFNRPLKWQEEDSRDTRENALRTIALLKPAGIDHIVLVTHGYHMPRAMRAFTEAAGPGHQGRAGADGPGAPDRIAGARMAAELARLQPDAAAPARAARPGGGGLMPRPA